jgi:uncharacterized protein (DUF885 family)
VTDAASIGGELAADLIAIDPLLGADWGIPPSTLPSFDPDWLAAKRAVFARAAARAAAFSDLDARVIRERAETEVAWIDSGEAAAECQAALDSPLFRIRFALDDLPAEAPDDFERVASYLAAVPAALDGLRASLRIASVLPARRQVLASAEALVEWSEDALIPSAAVRAPKRLQRDIARNTAAAAAAFADMAGFLRSELSHRARASDAVGAERFALWSSRYAGAELGDADAAWAAEELAQVTAARAVLEPEVEASVATIITGEPAFLAWAQDEVARARSATRLHTSLPPIAVRLKGADSQQAYYSPATEDGAQPATVWLRGGDGPHYVDYVQTLLFHESIPGHHVEASLQRRAEELSRFRRLVYIPGHSEGWGLYAEGLAVELGLIVSPAARSGALGSRALRLASLIVDVGVHCAGEWTFERATALVAAQGLDDDTAQWWVGNMIGRPGHRASYAAGERVWRDARRIADASGEDRDDFHARVLGLGPMGLDLFRSVAGTPLP